MPRSAAAAAAAAAATAAAALLSLGLEPAAAQDWGTTGSWELLAPTTQAPATVYRGPGSVAGTLVVTANNSATGGMNAAAYDPFTNAWSPWPDVSQIVAVADPFCFSIGGVMVVIDETNLTAVATITSAAARSTVGYTWSAPLVTGGPPTPRFGQRFLAWGSTVWAFSGVDVTSGVTHNDLWAIDATRLAAAPSGGTGSDLPLMWAQVQPDGAPGMPPGRVGYSWVATTGSAAVLFGGVSVTAGAPPGTLPDVCYDPAQAAAYCYFHRSVWLFLPGDVQAGAGAASGANWLRLAEAGVNGGPVPTGRFSVTAGVIGDELFVYGGTTATGPAADMWVYNLLSQTWAPVAPSSPAPPVAGTDCGYGAGLVLGHHLYRVVQLVDAVSGDPLPNTAQLWRWTPTASVGGGSGTPAAAPTALTPAVTAALVVTILLSLANTALLVALARSGGVLPEWAQLPWCGGAGSGWRRPAAADAGFYASSSDTDALPSGGGYVAPA